MPVFMIERNFAEQLAVTPEGAASNSEILQQTLICHSSITKTRRPPCQR